MPKGIGQDMNASLSWPESELQFNNFIKATGLVPALALKALQFGYYAEYYGLPRLIITSGKRDASWVKAAQARWDRGDRAGLKVRPATNSDHNTGKAFDFGVEKGALTPAQSQLAGEIGEALGLTWGGRFKGAGNADPIHFSLR